MLGIYTEHALLSNNITTVTSLTMQYRLFMKVLLAMVMILPTITDAVDLCPGVSCECEDDTDLVVCTGVRIARLPLFVRHTTRELYLLRCNRTHVADLDFHDWWSLRLVHVNTAEPGMCIWVAENEKRYTSIHFSRLGEICPLVPAVGTTSTAMDDDEVAVTQDTMTQTAPTPNPVQTPRRRPPVRQAHTTRVRTTTTTTTTTTDRAYTDVATNAITQRNYDIDIDLTLLSNTSEAVVLTVGVQLSTDSIVVYVIVPLLGLFGFTGVVCTITYCRRRRYVRRSQSPRDIEMERRRDYHRVRRSPPPSISESTESEIAVFEMQQQRQPRQRQPEDNNSALTTLFRPPHATAHGAHRPVTRSQTTEHRASLA